MEADFFTELIEEEEKGGHMKGKTEIKICGITSIKEAAVLADEKVDYAGMVLFYEKSKRNNTLKQAEDILQFFRKRNEKGQQVKTVAVVVSPTKEQITEIQAMGFDYIQIHGSLTEEVLEAIHIPIFRAVWAGDKEMLRQIKGCEKIEALLLDGMKPGTGEAFDWRLIEEVKKQLADWNVKLILAGGLTVENVREAIRTAAPHGVDVSSGVEFCRDKIGKDPDKIKRFVQEVRKE